MAELLVAVGLRFQRQPDIPGHPDFRLTGTRILIFCDSSFWHGRRARDVTGASFHRNRSFWTEKLRANRARDLRTSRHLRRAGWSVQRFWDDHVLINPNRVKNRLKRLANARG